MKQVFKSTATMIGFIVMYFVLNIVFLIIAFNVGGFETLEDLSGNATVITLIATQLATLGILYLLYRRKPFNVFMRVERVPVSLLVWAFVAGVAMLQVSGILVLIMQQLIPTVVENYIELIEASIGSADIIWTLLAVAILAPIVEELLMRGVLFRVYERTHLKPWLIILISGVLFGLFHMNIVQGVFTTVAGIFFACGYYWTRSIWVPIVMHLANNLLAISLGALPEVWLESTAFIVVSYGLIAWLPIALYQIKKRGYRHTCLKTES